MHTDTQADQTSLVPFGANADGIVGLQLDPLDLGWIQIHELSDFSSVKAYIFGSS